MRPTWICLSLLAHAAGVGVTLGLALGGGAPATRPPRVEVLPTMASMPARPAAQPLPPIEAEPPPEEPLPSEPAVARPIEPPPAPPPERAAKRVSEAATLQRVVAAVPEPVVAASAALAADPSADVDAQRCADNEPPQYPEHDRRLGHEGEVVLRVSVDAEGRVDRVDLASPSRHPGLNREALRAVRGWRFTPARRAGLAVASVTEVVVEFRLQDAGR
ncbi:MAG: energy transducer TonB [Planctomycetes bacterium]|nr:energy transducer TonB [Planctomycetota bacterium]